MHELVRVEQSPLAVRKRRQRLRRRKGTKELWQKQQTAAQATPRKKQRRSVPAGQMHVQATFNNTIITFTDKKGAVLCASSAGACGFRGSKKGTAYAAQIAAEKAAELCKEPSWHEICRCIRQRRWSWP